LFEIGPVDWNSEIWMATGYTKRTTFNIKLKINF
jgi:hypothetical protein